MVMVSSMQRTAMMLTLAIAEILHQQIQIMKELLIILTQILMIQRINTVGSADGTGDDIDGVGNSAQDANGDGLVDNSTDADDDGIADVIDEAPSIFGGLGTTTMIIPDLFPNFTFGNTTFNQGDSRFLVININEIAGANTAGQIEFFVPNSVGFTYTFNATLTNATVIASEAVNNPDWTVSNTGSGLLFTSNTVIPANGRSRIAIEITGIDSGAEANTTVNVTPGLGGKKITLRII